MLKMTQIKPRNRFDPARDDNGRSWQYYAFQNAMQWIAWHDNAVMQAAGVRHFEAMKRRGERR